MKQGSGGSGYCLAAIVLVLGWSCCVVAGEPPDSELNPATGNIESVDASGPGSAVRHVIDGGPGGTRGVTTLSSAPSKAPRIAIQPDGDSWVAWWQDAPVDSVWLRVNDLGSRSWSMPEQISLPAEDSRHPELIHGDDSSWVVYQIDRSSVTDVAVVEITDSPEPIPTRSVVGTASSGGDVAARIRAEDAHVWVTWVDSSSEVGWSEWDAALETWGDLLYESYVGSTVEDAREQIRETVLGL